MLHSLTSGEAQSAFVESRSFQASDSKRLIAWMGMCAPEFLGGHIVGPDARAAAQSFLKGQSRQATHVAIHARNGFCAGEFRKNAGFNLSGPVAAIDVRTGDVFIDPALKGHRGLTEIVSSMASAYAPLALRA